VKAPFLLHIFRQVKVGTRDDVVNVDFTRKEFFPTHSFSEF